MKKIAMFLAIGLVAIIVLAVENQLGGGRGGEFTATTSAQKIAMTTTNGMDGTLSYAVCISVQNMGTNTIYVGYNFPNASMFNKAVVNNEAIPIDYYEYFEFHGDKLSSLWVKTTVGSSAIKVGAY